MPKGMTSPKGGLQVRVLAVSEDHQGFTEMFTIPEGQTFINYKLKVLPNEQGYIIHYMCFDSSGNQISYSKYNPENNGKDAFIPIVQDVKDINIILK